METTQPPEQNTQVNCSKHPMEHIQRVSTQLSSNKHVFCLECLLENQQNPSEMLTISEFLALADDFYRNNPHKPTTSDLKPPPEYLSVFDDQKRALDDLREHLIQEKLKIENFFDHIKDTFVQLLEEQRKEHLDELDKQMFRLQYWHVFFEKRLRTTFPNTTDFCNSEQGSLLKTLETIKDPIQFEAYIRSIKEDLNEEILRINQSKPLDQDKKFKLPSLYKRLIEQQQNTKPGASPVQKSNQTGGLLLFGQQPKIPETAKPTYLILQPSNPKQGSIKTELETNIQDLLDKFLTFHNSIPDILDDCNCPDSQIIDPSHYRQLIQWLPDDYKYKNLKLLYRGTRDGLTSKDFHEKCDKSGPTVVLIHCRFYESTKKSIIGGFLDQDWNSDDQWIVSDKAFLFSLTGKVKCPLIKKNGKNEYAAYGKADWGPTFGSSYDLALEKNFTQSWIRPGDYENSDLLIDSKNQRRIWNFGDHHMYGTNYFFVEEIEVYTFK